MKQPRTTYNDYPMEKVVAQAEERINATGGNAYVQQKWTCKHCGARQTMEEKNKFFRSGKCEECRKVTVITKCNDLLVIGDSE